MPTILYILGWRLYFYSNEGSEPMHIHAEKGEMECKYWIIANEFEIKEDYCHRMSPPAKREIKRIIYEHFDLIVSEWNLYFSK